MQKEAQPSVEYIYSKLTYFSEAWYFCLKYPFFIDLMYYTNFLRKFQEIKAWNISLYV